MLFALAANPDAFFGNIKNTTMNWVNAGVDGLLIPIGVIICGVFFIFLLIQAVADYQEQHSEQMKGKIFFMLLIIIIAALLLTKNQWWGFVFGG